MMNKILVLAHFILQIQVVDRAKIDFIYNANTRRSVYRIER